MQDIRDMKLSETGKELIQHFEDCKLKAYQDAKKIWTIGWGNTFYANGTPVKKGDTITQAEADILFDLIVPRFELLVQAKIKIQLLQHQFDALVCFCYNAGVAYRLGNVYKDYQLWDNVNKRMNSKTLHAYWRTLAIKSGGVVQNGLIRRRFSEADMFTTGVLDFHLELIKH